jgi:hypothetical protein
MNNAMNMEVMRGGWRTLRKWFRGVRRCGLVVRRG